MFHVRNDSLRPRDVRFEERPDPAIIEPTDAILVGVTWDVELPGMDLFWSHPHLHGGPAPVRRFLPELIDLIWNLSSRRVRQIIEGVRLVMEPTGSGVRSGRLAFHPRWHLTQRSRPVPNHAAGHCSDGGAVTL